MLPRIETFLLAFTGAAMYDFLRWFVAVAGREVVAAWREWRTHRMYERLRDMNFNIERAS